MAMSEDKNPPLSEEVEFDAVDLEKQPKRVRKAEAKPPTRKKSTQSRREISLQSSAYQRTLNTVFWP